MILAIDNSEKVNPKINKILLPDIYCSEPKDIILIINVGKRKYITKAPKEIKLTIKTDFLRR